MSVDFNNNMSRLVDIVYSIKHKITDLEYYNIMETMTAVRNSRSRGVGTPVVAYRPPSPSSASTTSNISSDHISSVSSCSTCSSDICY